MRIAIAFVMEPNLDLASFANAAENVTGQNCIAEIDRNPGFSPLHDQVRILDNFAGNDAKISYAICNVGFMFAGYDHDIAEVIEYTRGMPHLDTDYCQRGIRCTIAVGSLDQWARATIMGCRAHKLSTARYTFNAIYKMLDQKGLSDLFDGYRVRHDDNNTFLLERK